MLKLLLGTPLKLTRGKRQKLRDRSVLAAEVQRTKRGAPSSAPEKDEVEKESAYKNLIAIAWTVRKFNVKSILVNMTKHI